MFQTLQFQLDMETIKEFIEKKRTGSLNGIRSPVHSLYYAYLEEIEKNKILTRVLIEASARGIELRTLESRDNPAGVEAAK